MMSLQELQSLPNCLHVYIFRVIGFLDFTKFRCSTPEIANVFS